MNRILSDTLRHLAKQPSPKKLVELHLTRYFTIARLDDGSVGACMSYYRLPDQVLAIAEVRLQACCEGDLFFIKEFDALSEVVTDCVREESQRYYLITAVTAAIASALSASVIASGGDKDFEVVPERPSGWVQGAESALVVGFGGFLQYLVAQPTIRRIHTIDFLYDPQKEYYASPLAAFKEQHQGKSITASTRLADPSELQSFDLISITGSTLCNGTLEYFLTNTRGDSIVVLQGQSASIHPKILFEAGVKWVATTLKPDVLSHLARGDRSGEMMRPLLDGGLPLVYLLPRPA